MTICKCKKDGTGDPFPLDNEDGNRTFAAIGFHFSQDGDAPLVAYERCSTWDFHTIDKDSMSHPLRIRKPEEYPREDGRNHWWKLLDPEKPQPRRRGGFKKAITPDRFGA